MVDGQTDVSDAVSKTCTGAELVWRRAFVEKTHARTHTHTHTLFYCNVIYSTRRVSFLLIFISVPCHSYSPSVLPSTFLPCLSPAGFPCHVLLPCSGLPTPLPALYLPIPAPLFLHRSQWPRGLRRSSAVARLLRSWVRIPPGAWMPVCRECCVLSGRGLCDELITRPEESYRLWRVAVCDLETSSFWSQTSINCD